MEKLYFETKNYSKCSIGISHLMIRFCKVELWKNILSLRNIFAKKVHLSQVLVQLKQFKKRQTIIITVKYSQCTNCAGEI